MSWQQFTRSKIKQGAVCKMNGSPNTIGLLVKIVGHISQFGGNGSGGAMFVKCKIIESKSESYKIGSYHELNAEFLY